MAVAGVGVERHVEQHADVEAGLADGARRAADEIVGVERLAAVVGAQLGIGVGEQRDRRDAERHRLLGGRRRRDRRSAARRPAWRRPARACRCPSMTKIGQIRSAGVSTFSATSRRDQSVLRLRRMRTAGNAPAARSAAGRSSGATRRWATCADSVLESGLVRGFMAHLCLGVSYGRNAAIVDKRAGNASALASPPSDRGLHGLYRMRNWIGNVRSNVAPATWSGGAGRGLARCSTASASSSRRGGAGAVCTMRAVEHVAGPVDA